MRSVSVLTNFAGGDIVEFAGLLTLPMLLIFENDSGNTGKKLILKKD